MTKKILLLLFLLLLLNSPANATNWCDDATAEGCWTFDEATYTDDSSSNGRDLTVRAGVSEISVGCFSGDCADVDGSANSRLAPAQNNDFESYTQTSVLWFGNNTNPSGNGMFIFSDDNNNRVGYVCKITTATGKIGCAWYTTSSTAIGTLTGDDDIRGSTLKHVAIIYNSAGTSYLYVNGVDNENASIGSVGFWQANSSPYYGDNLSSYWEELDGTLDDMAFFSEVKDSTDINEIMINGLDGTGAPAARRIIMVN